MSGGGVRGGVAVEVSNDAVVEYTWIEGALTHAQQHYDKLLQRCKGKQSKGNVPMGPLSEVSEEVDEKLYRAFRTAFPTFNIRLLQPDDPLWPYLDREYWSPLLRRYKACVADATLLTLIRVDVSRPPVGENAILVPRLKWVMVEVAREREGMNEGLTEGAEGINALVWGGEEGGRGQGRGEAKGEGQGHKVRVMWERTKRFYTLHVRAQAKQGEEGKGEEGKGKQGKEGRGKGRKGGKEEGEKALSKLDVALIEDMVNKLGGGDDVRTLVEAEVRRQASAIDLVTQSNKDAVKLQALQSCPPIQYRHPSSQSVMSAALQHITDTSSSSSSSANGHGDGAVQWPVVVEGALQGEVLAQARREAQHMKEQGLLQRTPQAASNTRLDSIRWMSEDELMRGREGEGQHEQQYPALHHCVLLLKGLAHEIMNHSAEEGRGDVWGGWRGRGVELRVPTQCMLACYPGGGAYYVAHRDNLPESCMHHECGGNDREVTAVLYLNEPPHPHGQGWDTHSRGGALRCYSGAAEDDDEGSTAQAVVDVAPVGGRLVLFPSRELLHEVRPSSEERWALSMWILGAAPTVQPTLAGPESS